MHIIISAAATFPPGKTTMLQYIDRTMPGGPVLRIVASERGIRAIEFERAGWFEAEPAGGSGLLEEAGRQLAAYFSGKLERFSLPLDMQGTEFQQLVWGEVARIPYGETRSYADIARAVLKPNAVRAVGAANGANPVPIVVPCHRVIGSTGKLVGYGGGIHLKLRLLELEGCKMGLFA
jgi:methylated-DNA-[protein]-cysteine S-methyltransferase